MKYLFQKTIPLLNEYVKYQKPINLVNLVISQNFKP